MARRANVLRAFSFHSMPITPALSFGLVEGRPVFMDVAADSYFLLDAAAEADFLSALGRSETGDIHLSAGPSTACTEIAARAACSRPARSLLDEHALPETSLLDVLAAAWVVRNCRRALARRPMPEILQELGASGGQQALPMDLPARAASFQSARRMVPVGTNCLLDSLALLRWLGPVRDGACLVFGVKLHPFAAHCWVQTDAMLLNDRTEHVRRFEPVRVIRCSAPTP